MDGAAARGYSFEDGRHHTMGKLLESRFAGSVDAWLWDRGAEFPALVGAAVAELMAGRIRPGADAKCRGCRFGGVCPAAGGGAG